MNPFHDASKAAGPSVHDSAVVLLNFGGPRALAEVPRFLFEILRDPNTLQIASPQWIQDLLARYIASRRSREVTRQYAAIGGASPIVVATERMAEALSRLLSARGTPLRVLPAHRYLPGHTRAAAARLMEWGVRRIVAVPLYPHFSWATTGSSAEQLQVELSRAGFAGHTVAVRSYPDAPQYVAAVADRLSATLAGAGLSANSATQLETVILCSAHGLPASYVERGDPYRVELSRTLDALRARFPDWRFALSFQSRVGPAEWLRPYTDGILPILAEEGTKHVVFLPLAFVNDHLETLYEIGHTYFGAAQRLGMKPVLVPAVEDHPAFMAELADRVEAALAPDGDGAPGRGVVPLAELLPPDQSFCRRGLWLWSAWLAAFAAALANALLR